MEYYCSTGIPITIYRAPYANDTLLPHAGRYLPKMDGLKRGTEPWGNGKRQHGAQIFDER